MKKIADLPGEPGCKHPSHDPPTYDVEPGVYTHTCPACGAVQTIVVPHESSLELGG